MVAGTAPPIGPVQKPAGSGTDAAILRLRAGAEQEGYEYEPQEDVPLPQAGGGPGWGLFYLAKIESSGTIAPTLTLPRLGGGN